MTLRTTPETDTETAARTLVLVDNQGGFESQTKLTNGNHIEVDGETTINPLHIEAAPEHIREKLDTNPYSMSVRSAKTLIAGTMENQGADLSEIIHTLTDLIHATYRDAGIYPTDFDSHANPSPDMTDLIRIGEDMLDNPGEYTVSSNELEADELQDEVKMVLRRLNGFTATGEHRNLVGQTDVTIEPGAMNYLDLRNVDSQDSSERSVQLFQMARLTYETFKIAQGESMAVFDEAHNFLEDERMIEWLATASRQMRNYSAGLWLVSQSPSDFASTGGEKTKIDKLKDVIREQCSTIDFFQLNHLDESVAEKFDMGPQQRSFVTNDAVAGEAELGYTTAMTNFSDRSGWFEYEVKRGPVSTAVNTYKRSKHGDFEEYMDRVLAEHGGGA